MIKLFIDGDIDGLEAVEELGHDYSFSCSSSDEADYLVRVSRTGGEGLSVLVNDNHIEIGYGKGLVKFYRALGLALEAIADGKQRFEKKEIPIFDSCGCMLDMSRNAVLLPETLQDMFRKMAVMGVDSCMLYCEDIYEIEGMPYFGHLRGRYAKEELKALDSYARKFGIELVPHIQTLGHMERPLKWNCMSKYKEADEVLLADSEDTYELIEKMLQSAAECFTSRKIHLGLDEAWMMGLGANMKQHGYQERFPMFCRHLTRVKNLAKKYGFTPCIYGDMFFRTASNFKTNYCRGTDTVIPDEMKQLVPQDIKINYWNYYSAEEEVYDVMLQKHAELCKDVTFTGGVWVWDGPFPDFERTVRFSVPALEACKKRNIREVIAAAWNDGTECNLLFAYMGIQLYAEYNYNGHFDEEALAKRLEFTCGLKPADITAFRDADRPDGFIDSEASRFLLYNDPLMGIIDRHVMEMKTDISKYYKELSGRIKNLGPQSGYFRLCFDRLRAMVLLFENKADYGVRLTAAYKSGNKKALLPFAEESKVITEKFNALHKAHYEEWHAVYKPFGWEIFDIRYGALISRFETLRLRLEDYISDKIASLPELEQDRLWYDCRENSDPDIPFGPMPRHFARIFTVNNISKGDFI